MDVTSERFDKAIGNILASDRPFPRLEGENLAHGKLALPDAMLPERWSIVLAYRAHW